MQSSLSRSHAFLFDDNLGMYTNMELLSVIRLEISLGDFLLMATSGFTGNTSLGVQCSIGKVLPFHSCPPTNTFLVWTL